MTEQEQLFEQVYRTYGPSLYRFCLLQMKNPADAEDVDVYKRQVVVSSLAAAMEAAADTPPDKIWVIGGSSVYAALLTKCRRAYVTRVDAVAEGADSFFPNLDKLPGWTVDSVSDPVTENGLTYRFYEYVNTKLDG